MDYEYSTMFQEDVGEGMMAVRWLQEKKTAYADAIDYTVLSVAVATLALILVVEILRHKIDHMAIGRPFFQTVLSSVNSELATLGIVEFVVFLIQKYYAGLDKAQKEVFADVHFMLFYCALFNALQSVLLAISSYSVANRLWVQTESLELDHYIEIREEFERVDCILYADHHQQFASTSSDPRQAPGTNMSEYVFEYNVSSLRKLWARLVRSVKYPILSRKHEELLVQVRFHELRIHFLQSNDLPLQLHVSDYLKRSLLGVLQTLAHISAVAWLLLTAGICLLYYFMGIVIYVTDGNLAMVGISLTWIYLASMVFFVLLSLVIYNKMKYIFSKIMRMKLMAASSSSAARTFSDHDEDVANKNFKSGMSSRRGEKEVENQSDLFWGGNPDYITVIIQFAQFGFALALSILLVFWDDINVKGAPVDNWVYLFTVFLCYAAFVAIMAHVIPRYTLCTNLGQLVNKAHLQETLGQFYLEEAERKRQLQLEEQDDEHYYEMETFDEASALSKDSPTTAYFVPIDASVRTATSNNSNEQEKPTLLAELVQMDTESLRSILPVGTQSTRSSQQDRRLRRKAVSDGVALMRSVSGKPPKAPTTAETTTARLPPRVVRKKSNSASDAVLHMKEIQDGSSSSSGSITGLPRSRSGPSLHNLADTSDAPPSRPSSRVRRKKSSSASDAIMAMKEPTSETVDGMPRSTSGASLKQLAGSQFDVIDEHRVSLGPAAARAARSKTLSSSSAPLPPLDEVKDPLVGSLATLSHPQEDAYSEHSDDQSDIDDIPKVRSFDHHVDDHHAESPTLYDVVTDYFVGPKYPVVSAVFGTLVCFWVVGQRVEGLLLATDTLPDLKNTFQFPLMTSFWWETTWLSCFIVASAFVTLAFGPGRASSNKERTMSLAGFLDVALASACLALLMVAEAQRCFCTDGDDAAGCCSQFGSRSSGGLGNIEPWTSLIVLRVFRFWFAKRVVGFLDKYTKWSSKDSAAKRVHHHHDSHHGHGHEHGHGDPRDLAVEVWKGALCLYPDVVEEHGEFSTELLQAMLGVDAGGSKTITQVATKPHNDDGAETVTMDANISADELSNQKKGGYVPKRVRHRQSSDGTARSSNIVLGKIADPAIAKNNDVLSSIPMLDSNPLVSSEHSVTDEFTFVRPNAKLLRSMRRCDRKLLPLINTWTVVDMVITKYEIVYFEAIDVDDVNKAKYSESDLFLMETGRKALNATNGGKGLRLKDVAKGRKVVGHLVISAVDNVHVDRILPHEDKKQEEDSRTAMHDEFWEPNEKSRAHDLSREARWSELKEDRLMIHSNHGTLCFRFYSDLHDMEAHRDRCLDEREDNGSLHKDLALLWCQTIGRVCKRAQLKQKLVHYGDGDDEELRDYLHVVDPHNEGNEGVMSKIHRRASSAIDLLPMPRIRRGSSVPEESRRSNIPPRFHRGNSLPIESPASTPETSDGEGAAASGAIQGGDRPQAPQVAEYIA